MTTTTLTKPLGRYAYPPLVSFGVAEREREATYQASLLLVARIDDDLTRGIRHYRSRGGVLLKTLDQVVQAILADDLMVPEEPVPNAN